MGGAKQSGHAVIAALNDPKSASYHAIRDGKNGAPPVQAQAVIDGLHRQQTTEELGSGLEAESLTEGKAEVNPTH